MARRLAGLLLVVLVLAGCNGDSKADDPPKSPSPSSSPTESESSAPVAPEMPAAAKKPDVAGAKAFTQHFWAMVDYAEATGDTKGLRKLVRSGCTRCLDGADWLDQMRKDGGRVIGEPRVVQAMEVSVAEAQQYRTLTADVRHEVATTGQKLFYGDGDKRNAALPGGVVKYRLTLVLEEGDRAWSVAQWQDM